MRDYSDFERHPWERLLATLDYVSLLVYGGREAVAGGRGCARCTGGCTACVRTASRYHALEPDAYAWVHATLLETYVAGTPVRGCARNTELRRFYGEYRSSAA